MFPLPSGDPSGFGEWKPGRPPRAGGEQPCGAGRHSWPCLLAPESRDLRGIRQPSDERFKR